jgi:hypothetical protein
MNFDRASRTLIGSRLLEADWHVREAHRQVQQQRAMMEELMATRGPSHAAAALLSLMMLMLPIMEDLRLHIVGLLASQA